MTDVANEIAPQPQGAQPTLDEIKEKLEALIELAPAGGTLFGITVKVRNVSMSTMILEGAWRIEVKITIPRKATLLCALLARWKVPGSTRTIQFILRGDSFHDTADGDVVEALSTTVYLVLNGDYPYSFFSRQESTPRDFRDEALCQQFGAAFASENLEDALKVIGSEITGEKAFKD